MKTVAVLLSFIPLAVSAQRLDLSRALDEATRKGPEAQILQASLDSANLMVREVRAVAYPKLNGYVNAGLGHQVNTMGKLLDGLGGALGAYGQSIGSLDHRIGVLEDSSRAPHGNSMGPLAAVKDAMGTSSDDPYWSLGYGLQVTQPLFTFGKVTTALNMAKTQDQLTAVRMQGARIAIQGDVVSLYTASVLAKAKLETTRRSVERQKAVVDQMQRNFQMGFGARAQVLLAKSTLLRLTPELLAGERDARVARKALNRLLGRNPDDTTELDTLGMPALEARRVPTRDELLKSTLAGRQDLKVMRAGISLQEDYAKILRANNLPNIAAMGKFGFTAADQDMGNSAKNAFKWENREWSVGLGLQWNIFDGFEQSSKSGEVRAAVRQMQVREGDLRRMIEMDVDRAISDRIAADSSLAAAQEGVAAATEARDWFSRNFANGSGQLSDLLQAEENQRLAELGLLAARLERTKTAARISLVQGQDLISISEAP
ncbi:MAG: TolC family protein [Fibrobacteres bacterium]|nr:TolC family protein [Fibrobacterota bacterium]